MREACGGLGIDITDAQFSRVIALSMPSPSWDPVMGTLEGVLDLKIVISHLNRNGAEDKDSHHLEKIQM